MVYVNYKRKMINGRQERIHRLVMEKSLGRRLTKDEVVHHKDGDMFNNSLENLELITRARHSSIHKKKCSMLKLTCPECKKNFLARERFYKWKKKAGQKNFFCSISCSARFQKQTSKKRKIILRGLANGWTGYKIAKEFNIDRRSVYLHIKQIKAV